MKILFIEWASFGNADMKDAFAREGHQVVRFAFYHKGARRDAALATARAGERPGAGPPGGVCYLG